MECKERLEKYLRENDVAFDVREHPSAFTAQRVAAEDHVPGRMFAKVVIVTADGELRMVVMPAPECVDRDRAREALGVKELLIATESDFGTTFADCDLGAMPPFGNLYGLPVCVDASLTENELITFQAGTHTTTMTITVKDFIRLVKPQVIELSMRPAIV
jgi:Ala-tRNA(Pro) deacylase